MRVGFLVWNRFQVGHFAEIARWFDEPDFIFIDRDINALEGFDPTWLTKYGAYTRFLREDQLSGLDGEYDVVLSQFTPALEKPWEKTRLVMCQYSMAKPKTAYNARWFAADLGLVYGAFSEEIINKMCLAVQCGNARFDPLFEDRLEKDLLAKVRQQLDPEKKTVVFLPTWGDLNSRHAFETAIAGLAQKYNVIYQPHHLTPLREQGQSPSLGGGVINAAVFGPVLDIGPYLMAVADVVLSDMSGAIFDALYCGRPVVLLGQEIDYETHRKADPTALEIASQASIGPLVTNAGELESVVDTVLKNHPFRIANEQLVKRCFVQRGHCAKLAADAVKSMARSAPKSPLQMYAGIQVRDLLFSHALDVSNKRGGKAGAAGAWEQGAYMRSAMNGLRLFLRLLPKRIRAPYLRGLGFVAYGVGANKVGDELYLLAARNGSPGAAVNLAKKAQYDGREKLALQMYRLAGPRSMKALREHVKLAHRMGDFFSTGLAVETWTAANINVCTKTFYQYAAAASKMRFSRIKWREILGGLQGYWLNMNDEALQGERIDILHTMGFVNTAKALAHSKNMPMQELDAITSGLGKLAAVLEASAQNDLLPIAEKICLKKENDEYVPLRLSEAEPGRVFEAVTLLNFSREDAEISEGQRQETIELTRHCMDAVMSMGYAVLPRLQVGVRGAIPILGRYPSMTWHSVACDVPGQLHLKVGTYKGHIIIDDRGYSGWASIATAPLSALIEKVDAQEAEEQWRHLYKSIVKGGLSKYTQAAEKAPAVENYLFLPMQILDDTVAEHADINSLELLHALAAWHKKSGQPVVVKRHPRCTFKSVAEALESYARSGAIIVSNASIHDLIAKAACVVTVNSGVGAETLIHLKPVISTGGSDYASVTTRVSTVEQLQQVLEKREWGAVSEGDIKKFLWTYTKRYMPHFSDKEAIAARMEMLVNLARDADEAPRVKRSLG